jgi:hypothetical protein
MVGVGMGLHRPQQCEPILAHDGQVAFQLFVHRVDDDGFPRGLVKHQVGVGAGGAVK